MEESSTSCLTWSGRRIYQRASQLLSTREPRGVDTSLIRCSDFRVGGCCVLMSRMTLPSVLKTVHGPCMCLNCLLFWWPANNAKGERAPSALLETCPRTKKE